MRNIRTMQLMPRPGRTRNRFTARASRDASRELAGAASREASKRGKRTRFSRRTRNRSRRARASRDASRGLAGAASSRSEEARPAGLEPATPGSRRGGREEPLRLDRGPKPVVRPGRVEHLADREDAVVETIRFPDDPELGLDGKTSALPLGWQPFRRAFPPDNLKRLALGL